LFVHALHGYNDTHAPLDVARNVDSNKLKALVFIQYTRQRICHVNLAFSDTEHLDIFSVNNFGHLQSQCVRAGLAHRHL